MKRYLLVTAGLLAATIVYAGEHTVSQAGKKFSERKLTVAAGDSITFLNDDGTTHNVHSNTAGQEFDLGAQAPGTSQSHVFSTPGEVKVRCAIHPKMKMTVVVE